MEQKLCRLWTRAVVACLFVILAATSACWGQQAAGSITGTVVDPAGSAVANANVTVRDVDRGTTWETKTNSAGFYTFPEIPVGNVEVKAEAGGFSSGLQKAFALSVNQVTQVNFKLLVGKVTETVDVTTTQPLLQTASTEVSTTISSNVLEAMPMASRDINQLTLMAPGVISPNIFAFQSSQNTFGTGRPYVNGAREQDNNFSLDGMDINQPDNNDVAYVPAPDAVAEFSIITNNAPADYGNYVGGVVVETLKSGTNKFHGSVYEYFRNTDLNANTWQDKANALLVTPTGMGATIARPVLQWNNFGGTVGGPIIKNKLFFFADYSQAMNNTPATGQTNSLIPTPYLTGDFSGLCTNGGGTFVSGVCSNTALQMYSPVYLSGPLAGQIAPLGSRPAFLNNQVPISSSVAASLIALPEFKAQEEQLNYEQAGYVHTYQGDMKIDWQASEKDHISGRYSQMYTINTQTNGTDVLTPNLTREYPLKNFVVDYVRQISPSLVNDLRLGAQIFPADDQIYANAASVNLPEAIGLPGVQVDILPSMSFGYTDVGNSDGVEIFHDTTYELEDKINWVHGRHSIFVGFEWYKYLMNDVYAGNQGAAGSFNFNGQFSTGTNNGSAGSAFAFADFLQGLPQNVQEGVPFHFHLRNSLFGGFVQDNFQVSHNLTLNLGLRYELVTPRGDATKSNNVNFDLLTGTPEIGTNYNTYTGIDNLQPRIGFSWQPFRNSGGTVIRGAYDISSYMEGNGVNNMAVVNPPNVELHNVINTPTTLYPETTLDQGYSTFSAACTPEELMEFAPNCFASGQAHATNPSLQPAVDQQWNLSVQQQLGRTSTLTIGYVGNKVDHASDIYLYNQKELAPGGTAVPGPYMQPIVNAGAQARYNASDGISRFEALEVTLAERRYHGLEANVNYTWSKCMANSLGYFGSYGDEEGRGESQTQATQNFFQNEYDPKADYGRCTIDTTNAFGAYAVYDLPFGRGKQFGSGVNKITDQVIGGWQTSVNATLRSGFGITPFAGAYMGDASPFAATSVVGSYQPRPDCVAGVPETLPMQTVQIGNSIGRTNLNPAAVTEVAPAYAGGTYGNCQNGSLRGPSLKTADFNLTKRFPITEGTNLNFSAQFINLTNTPIFSVPASWWGQYSSCGACNGVRTTGLNGGAGNTVGAYGLLDGSNPGREIELSLKLNF